MVDSDLKRGSGRKLFFGLFIFPLMIAVGMAILLCTVVLLTREVETPESLIMAIKTGPPSKRWQKAFELSNEINQGRGMIRASGVIKEIIHTLKDRNEYDAKTRSYMALALSRFEDAEVVEILQEVLTQETEPEVQLHLMWGLGVKNAVSAAPVIRPFVKDEKDDVKKMAVYVLGVLGDRASIGEIEPLVEDDNRDVRWNAALALARLGNDLGYDVLLKMLDRQALENFENLPEDKIEEVMVNAAKGIALLGRSDSLVVLGRLAKEDHSLKVRQAAIEAIDFLNQKVNE